ncbi:MAG: hypothetical protein A2283_05585 [Lentisphaerae bacterium RIFOXYA12_FULL_48_11]|nr:MAG: hypothetical protein A2283_05585 [Lentisphaerae bacterium RIFOXYA12_FULL_48_11]
MFKGWKTPVEPNLAQLQNALDQTQGKEALDSANWRNLLINKVQNLDDAVLASDVKPFLEHWQEAALLNRENLQAILKPE